MLKSKIIIFKFSIEYLLIFTRVGGVEGFRMKLEYVRGVVKRFLTTELRFNGPS